MAIILTLIGEEKDYHAPVCEPKSDEYEDSFDFTVEEEETEGLLLPAVTAAREAAQSSDDGADLLIVNNGDGSDFLEMDGNASATGYTTDDSERGAVDQSFTSGDTDFVL